MAARNLDITAVDAPDLSHTVSLQGTFAVCESLTAQNADMNQWDTSSIIDLSLVFVRSPAFNGNISSWDTANATRMQGMFYYATSFDQDIGAWNTANVTDMSQMFLIAQNFNQDIGAWNTGGVTDMKSMFGSAWAWAPCFPGLKISTRISVDGVLPA